MTDPRRSLAGVRVLLTRPAEFNSGLSARIRQLGGTPIECPLIQIEPVATAIDASLLASVVNLHAIIFTSRNAVRYSQPMLQAIRQHHSIQVFAVGPATAKALNESGILDVIYPTNRADSESLLTLPAIQALLTQQAKILLVRGVGGRELLVDQIRQAGAELQIAEVYRRIAPCYDAEKEPEFWTNSGIDIVLLTSCEAVDNLIERVPQDFRQTLQSLQTITFGQRIAEYLVAKGFKLTPQIIDKMSDDAIIATCLDLAGNMHND